MAQELHFIFVIFKCFSVSFWAKCFKLQKNPLSRKCQATYILHKSPHTSTPFKPSSRSVASDKLTVTSDECLQLVRNGHRERGRNTEPSV